MFHNETPAAQTSTLKPWNESAPFASSAGWNAGVPELLVHSSLPENLDRVSRAESARQYAGVGREAEPGQLHATSLLRPNAPVKLVRHTKIGELEHVIVGD